MNEATDFCKKFDNGTNIEKVISKASLTADKYSFSANGRGLGQEYSSDAQNMRVFFYVPLTCAAHCEYDIKNNTIQNGEVWFGCD